MFLKAVNEFISYILNSMKVILDLVHDVFGPTIKFLSNECTTALLTDVGHTTIMKNKVVPGVQEVTAFIMMYSAMLDRGFSRDEFEKKIRSREPDGNTLCFIYDLFIYIFYIQTSLLSWTSVCKIQLLFLQLIH